MKLKQLSEAKKPSKSYTRLKGLYDQVGDFYDGLREVEKDIPSDAKADHKEVHKSVTALSKKLNDLIMKLD